MNVNGALENRLYVHKSSRVPHWNLVFGLYIVASVQQLLCRAVFYYSCPSGLVASAAASIIFLLLLGVSVQ